MTGFEEIDKMSIFGPKWAIFDSFCPGKAKTGYFWEKAKMSLPYAATLCKKPKQTYERFLRSKMYVRTHARTEANLKVPAASGGGPKRAKNIFVKKNTNYFL